MGYLSLRVLGELHVLQDDVPVQAFESDKVRALLAYLAVEADRSHRRETLLGLLWPDCPEQAARHNLSQALFNLRLALGDHTAKPPYLLINRESIQFNRESDYWLDLDKFNAHFSVWERNQDREGVTPASLVPPLEEMVQLYQGEFLQQFYLGDSEAFEEWILVQREALHRRVMNALTTLANEYEGRGDFSAARRYAWRQLELDPWREEAHGQVMRVLALDGQRSAALAQYEHCRRILAAELGVEPSAQTRELYEQIRAGMLKPKVEPPTHVPAAPLRNLPVSLTPFIGREQELADLARLIGDPECRCLTLVGPGGIGKTRLVLQAAANHRHEFAQGVAFVPLVTVVSVEAIVPAIAEALGFSFYGPTNPRLQLFDYLRDKQMLLVLDNVEQLLVEDPFQGNAAELFIETLQYAADIKLLLTAREPLNVQGEWVFEVEGLQIPEDDRIEAIESSSAVALFVQRAQRTRVGFTLGPEDRPSVVRLCRLVSGTPLALELAATWVRTLSVSEIVREIERDLDFLSSSIRDLPERHRSIRAVLDHSWKMLSVEERRVLADLSAFYGRFQRGAMEQVAGASLATLSTLVAKSLVRRTNTGHYDLHELVRQYAASKLTDDDLASVAERHSRYYLDWLERCATRLRDHRQKETATELAAEIDNLRAAWDWAVTHLDLARVCQVSPALWYLFELRSWFAEGEIIFGNTAETLQARATEIKPGEVALVAINAMRAHSGYFSFRLGKSAASYAVLSPSAKYLQSSPDQFAAMYALWYLGLVSWHLGQLEQARECLQASLDEARAAGERWYEAMVSQFIGIIALNQAEYGLANRYLREALERAREMGDPLLIAHILSFLGLSILALGKSVEAENFLRESLALTQEIEYQHGIGNALDGLGLVAQVSNLQEARTLFSASGDVFRKMGDLQSLSRVLSHQGYNSLALGDIANAQISFTEVLRLSREGGYVPFVLDALIGLAILWAKNSNAEPALKLVICVMHHPAATHDAKSRAEILRAALESRLTSQQVEAAQVQAQAKTFEAVVDEVLKQGAFS